MQCILCGNDTRVINSRPHKKTPSVWRRRQCKACGANFTTNEAVADETYPLLIKHTDGLEESFSLPVLMVSILQMFSHHEVTTASEESYWLAQTVAQEAQASATDHITTDALSKITYDVIKHYDDVAGAQYGARYGVITSHASQKPRRGRRTA